MDPAADQIAISTAVSALKNEVEQNNVVLKAALDKEFDSIRKTSHENTETVRETLSIADQHARDDQEQLCQRLKSIEVSVENIEMTIAEQKDQLATYEQQQIRAKTSVHVTLAW